MKDDVVILVAEHDEDCLLRLTKNLVRTGLRNPVISFRHSDELLDYLFMVDSKHKRISQTGYVLILDIMLPDAGGMDVLGQIKHAPELMKMPVVMIGAEEKAGVVRRFYAEGASIYIQKPVTDEEAAECAKRLGQFFSVITVPNIN